MFARHAVLVSTARQHGLTNPERVRGCRVYIHIPGTTGTGVRPTFGVKRDCPCLWGLFNDTHLVRRGERALTRFRTLHRAVIALVSTDDGVGCEIPQACRTIQAIIKHRVAVGGNGEGNDGEVVRWASERDLSRGGVPLFDGAVCGRGENGVCCCPGDVPYFVAVRCVEFNTLENGRSG